MKLAGVCVLDEVWIMFAVNTMLLVARFSIYIYILVSSAYKSPKHDHRHYGNSLREFPLRRILRELSSAESKSYHIGIRKGMTKASSPSGLWMQRADMSLVKTNTGSLEILNRLLPAGSQAETQVYSRPAKQT